MFQKSNKWNSAKDILLTESRQWDLKHHARVKGTCTKRKTGYWEGDICRIRKEKRLLSEPPAPQIDDCDTLHPPPPPPRDPNCKPSRLQHFNSHAAKRDYKRKGPQQKRVVKIKKTPAD